MHDRAARAIFCLVGLAGVAFGCIYMASDALMPFHLAFIARTGAIQSANAERLLLMMMHVVGSLFFLLSVMIIVLTRCYWAMPATRAMVPILAAWALLPVLWASWAVGNGMGVIEISTALALAMVAAFLSLAGERARRHRSQALERKDAA